MTPSTDLEDALDQGPWHVFHFVGHGGYDRIAEEGTLALADAAGCTDLVGADDLSRLLAEHHTLRLVVLNACNTGRSGALDAFSSTAGALMRREIPAVVAMQFEITDSAAIDFASAFYQNVAAKRRPVDASVVRARQALRRANKDTLEWGTPVLYLRAPHGRIFDTTTTPPPQPGRLHDQRAALEVEALYDEALGAFWTEQWDQAVSLLEQVLTHALDHPDAAAKLEQARRQQQMATGYARACAAVDTKDWEQAVAGFMSVADIDPTYRDVGERLEDAQRRQQLAGLRAEARRLHRAEQWAAVINIGERLHALDPAADPDGLLTSARAELAAAQRADQLASQYRTGLRLLDAAQWQQAVEALKRVAGLDPTYRDTAALLARARQELVGPTVPPPDSPHIARRPSSGQILRYRKAVNAVAFSPDGRLLAIAGADSATRIWDIANGQEIFKFTHDDCVLEVAFSPDGRRLATASADSAARIWDVTNGHEIFRLTHDSWVRGVAFNPDGQLLATASDDKVARVWDTTSGRVIVAYTHKLRVAGVAFNPDGRRLATAGNDKVARIVDLTSRQVLATYTHKDWVACVDFSPDGRLLAAASRDGTARIWSLDKGGDDDKE